jgi:hypothetical protein
MEDIAIWTAFSQPKQKITSKKFYVELYYSRASVDLDD